MKLLQCYIDNIITNALMEDINYIDAAADNLIPPEHESSAYYVAKDSGVVCGIEIAKRVFELSGENVTFKILMADGTKVKFTADIDGEKVSQVMLVCGSDGLGLEHPHWQYNLSLALKIQNYLNETYPGLMRPVNLRKERFNMHKTQGSLILEFGTHGNTLDEALGAVKYIADGIEAVLKK